MLLLGYRVAWHAALVCVDTLALAQELKLCENLRAVLRCLCAVPDLFLVLAVENLELVLFESLHSDDLTDRLLLALATLEEAARDEGGEEAPIILRLLMPYIESIDEEHAVLRLPLLIVLDHLPLLQV